MWTETTRVIYERKAARYATDLRDGERAVLEPLLPEQKNQHGRPRHVRLREVVNALLYLLRSGCPWRFLPRDFPPFTTVQHYFHEWRRYGLWAKINFALVAADLPADWQAVVALVGEQREMQLSAQLYNLVECHVCAPGHLELFLRSGTTTDLTTRLARCLTDWTGTPWLITLAQTSARQTLAEEEEARQQDIRRDAAEHPLVKAVLLAFPGATIDAIRDLTPDDPAPLTDTPTDDTLSLLMLDEADD